MKKEKIAMVLMRPLSQKVFWLSELGIRVTSLKAHSFYRLTWTGVRAKTTLPSSAEIDQEVSITTTLSRSIGSLDQTCKSQTSFRRSSLSPSRMRNLPLKMKTNKTVKRTNPSLNQTNSFLLRTKKRKEERRVSSSRWTQVLNRGSKTPRLIKPRL